MFGTVTALDRIDVRIAGNVIGLLGPNGAGKSTLLKCLLGVLAFGGTARVLGLSLSDDGARSRSRRLHAGARGDRVRGRRGELCAYVGELLGLPRAEAMQRAHVALDYVGVDDKRYQPIDGYSTGRSSGSSSRRRSFTRQSCYLLDEPTSGLHPRSRDEMLALVAELPRRLVARSCCRRISCRTSSASAITP